MKKNKMSLTTELDLTREGTAEMTRWCILIALHQSFGVGAARLNKILARAEKLGQESLDIAMMVNDRGMPSTDRSLALRRSWMPRNVDPDFRVPVLRSPRTRREEQLRMAGDVAAGMVWTLCAKACMDELGFSTERLLRLKEEALANYRQVNEEGHADGLDVAMEHLRRCAQAALKEDIVVENQPDEDRVRQSERDYEEQKRAFLKRAVMQQLGRKAGKGGLRVLSEKKLEEKATAAMAQLKENTWEKRISTPWDYQTGEVLAKGTAGELEASGIVPKGYHTSEWAKHENQKRRNRKYAISFEERQPEVKRGEKGRMMSVYTCYNAAGDVIGEGTARELWEAGVFSNDNAAYYTYKEQGGRCIKRGIAKMTCRKEMRKVGQNNARGEKADCAAKKPERPVLRKIKDPTPLDYDVHDLILYNAIARKEGRPELTYGYWAAAGKPARP